MKKISTFFAALFLCLGMAQAQDVYFSSNGNGVGKVFKNNTLVYNISDTVIVKLTTMQIWSEDSIYTAGYTHDSAYNHVQGRLWMNDSTVFSAGDNTSFKKLIRNGNSWMAAGIGKNEWENVTGLVWQDGVMLYSYSDSISSNIINDMAIDTVTGNIYSAGISSEMESNAVVWKNDTLLWRNDSISALNAIALNGTDRYMAGNRYVEGQYQATLWQNDSIIFSLLSDDSEFQAIALYDSSLYLAGYNGDTLFIWQDGEVLYRHECTAYSRINTLVVNEFGVYYAGQIDSIGTVWKDGEILYQPEDCENITAIVVMPSEPMPTLFTLTVEADSTAWGTVTGGGTYSLGDTATLQAFPNVGYKFLFWQDSVTANPREVIVTQDSTFIAHFGLIEYVIETMVEPENSGTVTGGGSGHYGDTLTLEAIPNPGFAFEGWHDGVTDNPRDIIVTQDSTFTARFSLIEYVIETMVVPENSGTVTGGGNGHYGDTLTLEAIPNPGFAFESWHDGVTDNPRDIIVTQDSTFTARFSLIEYVIETMVEPENSGTVTGGGIYTYGDTIQIEALPNQGFEFISWSDENTDNPRTIVVTESQSFTALFGIRHCVVSTAVTPEGAGTVTGGGTYDYGSMIQLEAHNNTGYLFDHWDDNDTTNPRTVVVDDDVTYTAVFKPLAFYITTLSHPEEGGTVVGGGIHYYNETATLLARPYDNYTFVCWSDGIISNPRTIRVTQDATYTAMFQMQELPKHTVTVTANDPNLGTVTGSGTYTEGSTVEISATANNDATFLGWDDGNTDNPRSIIVNEDMTFTAIFELLPTYSVRVRTNDPTLGTTFGSGFYPANTVVNIGAIPNSDAYFVGWQDGLMDNPRTITVTEDITYVANFALIPTPNYTVTVYYDENQGFILGAGTYAAGSTASLAAIPADGYLFVKWSDGSTDNPKEVLVDHDIVLAAFFNGTGIEEENSVTISLSPNPADDMIHIEGLEGEHEISFYNVVGMKVKTATLKDDSDINISELPVGLYLVRIGGKHTMKLIKK